MLSFNMALCQIESIKDKDTNLEKQKTLKLTILNNEIVKKYANTDTLFIHFKNTKVTNKKISIDNKRYNNKTFIDTTISYNYLLKEDSFSLIYKKYFDFDKMEANMNSLILKKDKKYLKNKMILNNTFFKTHNKYKTDFFFNILIELIGNKKIVFIIENDHTKKNKIILRQVMLNTSSNINFIDKI